MQRVFTAGSLRMLLRIYASLNIRSEGRKTVYIHFLARTKRAKGRIKSIKNSDTLKCKRKRERIVDAQ